MADGAHTRGLASGMLLLVLGAWAAIVPFIGDYMDFAYTPTSTWTWTSERGWYEVAPGAAAVVGGLLLLFSANRAWPASETWPRPAFRDQRPVRVPSSTKSRRAVRLSSATSWSVDGHDGMSAGPAAGCAAEHAGDTALAQILVGRAVTY
jgi:hypothetical protein